MNPPALPLISIVIPCFNQGQFLYESSSSALNAYSGALEIIVVDDGSTDPRTEQYLREIAALSSTVRIIRQTNQGLSGARNTGISAATGEFIQFLDADDLLIAGKLDVQIAQFSAAANLDVSICNFLLCDETRSHFSKPEEAIARFDMKLENFLYIWERGFAIPIHCALFHRRVFDSLRFDTALPAKEDWLFWCNLVAQGRSLAYLNTHDAIYRQHEQSMRRSVVTMGKSWLSAALKIDTLVGHMEPGFFDASIAWFNDNYRAHPDYARELAVAQRSSAISPTETAVATVPDTENKIEAEWIEQFITLADKGERPLISVVVPIFNHFSYLRKCLASVLQQGNIPLELICVDDASTDPRIRPLLEDLHGCCDRVRVIVKKQNQGISLVQNEAVALARGQFVAFLDCDDFLAAGALEEVWRHIQAHPEVDYFFTDQFDVDERDNVIRTAAYGGYETIKPSGDIRQDLLDGMVASHLKVIRRTTYLNVGGCDPRISGVQDWDLALKISETGRLYYIPKALYHRRVHQYSVTKSDSCGQFRKANVVRRRFAQHWYGYEHTPSSVLGMLRSRLQDNLSSLLSDDMGIAIFYSESSNFSLKGLKQAWHSGKPCVMDARGELGSGWIYFLREFNSYFDLIIYDRSEVYAAMVGYIWNNSLMYCPFRINRLPEMHN